MTGLPVSIDDIKAAAALLDGEIQRTPMLPAPRLSAVTGAEIFVKYENMQTTGSFKERGARVKLGQLPEADRRRGVVTLSAGNHAQAVAYHAARLGIPATIVMPETTPLVKVENTRAWGATVVLYGETLYESRERCDAIRAEQGLALVHPYDDPAGEGREHARRGRNRGAVWRDALREPRALRCTSGRAGPGARPSL
jgi:threonine dehydratase